MHGIKRFYICFSLMATTAPISLKNVPDECLVRVIRSKQRFFLYKNVFISIDTDKTFKGRRIIEFISLREGKEVFGQYQTDRYNKRQLMECCFRKQSLLLDRNNSWQADREWVVVGRIISFEPSSTSYGCNNLNKQR